MIEGFIEGERWTGDLTWIVFERSNSSCLLPPAASWSIRIRVLKHLSCVEKRKLLPLAVIIDRNNSNRLLWPLRKKGSVKKQIFLLIRN